MISVCFKQPCRLFTFTESCRKFWNFIEGTLMFIDKSVNFGFHLRRFDKLWFFLKNLPWYTAYSKVSNIVMTMRRTSLNLAPLKTKTRNRQSSWSLSGITYFLCPVRLPTKVESVPDGVGGIPRRVDPSGATPDIAS